MRIEVELPDLDGRITDEATISSWYVDEEDEVEKGEDLLELMVDEDTCSVRAPTTGRLVEIVAKEGDVVRVGDVLAMLDTAEEVVD